MSKRYAERQKAAGKPSYYQKHKDEPEFKEKQTQRSSTRYHHLKENNPELLKQQRKEFYDRHKDDPEFKQRNTAAVKKYYQKNKSKEYD